jgi:magnesium-transporting ATPase (P-type)
VLELRARRRAGDAVRALAELSSPNATLVRAEGEIVVPVASLVVGDEILVRPGERVPVDGIVISGTSSIDRSLLTGESVPVDVDPGDEVAGGALNTTGVLTVRLASRPGPLGVLGLVALGGSDPAIQSATSLLTACSWIMLPTAAVGWVLQGLMAATRSGRVRRILITDNAMVASLVALFAVATPLVSFPVYFCAWHSARGLKRLRRELGESWPELATSLAPLTVTAIALVGLAAWLVLSGSGWNETLIRATFIGLSAVAVPHLLLHGFAPLLDASARRRTTQPLRFGSPA